MDFFKSPIVRISFGLMIVTVSALLLSDLLGLMPDTKRAEINSRKAIAESLAVQFSMVISNDQLANVNETLRLLVERSEDVKSAALRRDSGELISEFGGHEDYWTLEPGENSTASQIQVPLFDSIGAWGTVELSFVDVSRSHQDFFLSNSFPAVVFLVALSGFFGYWMFLTRALKELDPSAVIPDRVREALDTLAEGLIIVDPKNNIVFSNQTFADKVGMKPNDLVGRSSESLAWEIEPGTGEEGELPWNDILQGDDLPENEIVTIKLSSGLNKIYKFVINTSVITSPEGDIRGAMITFDDVTEVERKNAELQDAMEKLEQGQREIRRQNQELHILATRDPLTNLRNRRSFMDEFEAAYKEALLSGEPLSCLMLDIDFFKRVNDDFGHSVGDIVIQLLAKIMTENSRPNDIVGRFGGEEFCIALPNTDSIAAFGQAELIRIAVEQSVVAEFENKHSITGSIGVTDLSHGASDISEMLEQADKALYFAKETGRNRCVRWPMDPEKDTGAELGALAIARVEQVNKTISGPTARIRDLVPTLEQATPTPPAVELERSEPELPAAPATTSKMIPAHARIDRSLLVDRINQGIIRSKRYETKVAVLSLEFDISQEKDEEQKSPVADELVTVVVERIKDALRTTDSVALREDDEQQVSVIRSGLSQLVILLSDLEDPDIISAILFRLLSAINLPIDENGVEFHVDADVGVSIYPLDSEEGVTLLDYSNSAMRQAKESAGSNNWQFYSQDVQYSSMRRRRMGSELHLALERGELIPHYQPKICLKRGIILGAEALLRWSHPEFGMVSPDEFIALAEQTKLVDDITMRLLTTVCRQLHDWEEAGHEDLTVTVNVSPVQFRNPEIAELIIARVNENEISPSKIEIEITETVMVQNVQAAVSILNQLSNAGFAITIDDFGVGHSTFSNLKNFPVDGIQIDRSFVADFSSGPNAAAIISSMIAMAQSLGLKVSAEGVESEDELRFIQDRGCDVVQGYLISQPLPAEGMAKLLAHPESIRRLIMNSDNPGSKILPDTTSVFGIINEFSASDAASPKLVVKS